MASDLDVHMEAVARHLLGEPNKHLSSKTELRYGTHGSLSVDLVEGIWHDYEHKTGGGVIDLIARETGLANGAAVAWMADELGIRLNQRPLPPRSAPIYYVYQDERGRPLLRVRRTGTGPGRKFSQQRYQDGHWIGGKGALKGARRVLYRLPELVAAGPDEAVYITEGEKDCDRLRGLGFLATTGPQGAGNWHLADHGALTGRHVIVLADLDEEGRKYRDDIVRDLTGKAASVRVLELPIPKPSKNCKDVSDWLDQCGGTTDELRRLAAEAVTAKREAGILDQLIERYFVARHAGKAVICYEDEDPELGRRTIQFLDADSLKLLHANEFVEIGVDAKGNPIRQPVVKAWLASPERCTYERLALLPNQEAPPRTYNLWRGLGVKPTAGDWSTIKEFLINVICGGNRSHYDYLEGWLAYCVQHPERQAEVAIVLRELKGTGKGTLGRMLLGIFRHHALHISNSRHLLGNFNSHLVDALFLFLDEAFWAGDKQGEGVLKALITEPSIMIEPKGLKPFLAPNRLKIVIAANADWVVPATGDERRYFAPTVSDHRLGDRAYFNKLYAAINGDELPALLAHLLTHDLSGFEVRDPPHTKELGRQKLNGATSVGRFWHDCLNEGALVGTAEAGWSGSVVTQVLHAAYVDHAAAHGDRHPKTDVQMVEELKKLWAGCGVKLTRPRGQPYIPPNGPAIERPNRYVLDTLENHRRAFLAAMNIDPADHAWPEVEDAP